MSRSTLTGARYRSIVEAGEKAAAVEFRARSVRFDPADRRVKFELTNRVEVGIPIELIQGLQDATDDQLAEVEMSPAGVGLSWPGLDVDLTVDGLVRGRYGNELWMEELAKSVRSASAQKAGSTKSAAKSAAARENGRKGGRPKKVNKKSPPRQVAIGRRS